MKTAPDFPATGKVFALVFLLHGSFLAANIISGSVQDRATQQTLHGANILIEELGVGAVSGEQGQYTIVNVPDGMYTVSASMIGYSVQKRTVVLSGDLALDFLLEPVVLPGQEIVVTADRARVRVTPLPFTDVSRRQVEERWTVQDIPMLLELVPGVYSYSDAGNGIGYTSLKIRGFDQRRVNVSINGVPLNDPEDHNVYWVDTPNLLSNVEDIQVQRGVGMSIYGRNAFGGSVNMVTSNFPAERRFGLEMGRGSYNTRKYSIDFLSGLIENTYSFYGRFSRIITDGYRHDSWSELWSYFLSGVRYGSRSTVRINVYGGPERSHAAWDASPESELDIDHRHNPYSHYQNETDNFNQPHYEFHHKWRIRDDLVLNNTLFYIHGEGYYEQLKYERELKDYGLEEFQTTNAGLFGADSLKYYAGVDLDGDWENDVLDRSNGVYTLKLTDLVRQKWVFKDQYGWVLSLRRDFARGAVTFGAELSTFASDHFGKVLWAMYMTPAANPEDPYYQYAGNKAWISPYVHTLYNLTEKLTLMGELQYQYKTYSFQQQEAGNFRGELRNAYDVAYRFVHPRFGVNCNLSPSLNVFGFVGAASREPSDDDLFDIWEGPDDLEAVPLFAASDTVLSAGKVQYVRWRDPLTKPEQLTDVEAGFGYRADPFTIAATVYHMSLRNEIVPYGGVDDDGYPITGNAESTLHQGIEVEGSWRLFPSLTVAGNISASRNRYVRFIYHDFDWVAWEPLEHDYSGHTIPLFPQYMLNLWAQYRLKSLSAVLAFRSVGKQYLDNTQAEARIIDPFSVVNVDLSWKSGKLLGLQSIAVHLKVNNLLDEEYETTGYWYGERYLYPAAGRNYFLSLTANL